MLPSILKRLICSIFISFIVCGTTQACSIITTNPTNIPPDRLEAYNKAKSFLADQSVIKGSNAFYDKLYDSSKYIYVGKVSTVLSKNEQIADSENIDSNLAYIKVSKGWKKGKVRNLQLKFPDEQSTCANLYTYKLEARLSYLFFENHRGLLTALPLNKKSDSNNWGAKAIAYYGDVDWYYSRNSNIHYANK